jgi:hypothetical protein
VNRKVILPDFGKFFRTDNRSPIDFVCRDGANLLHDFVYLRSFLHDASLDIHNVRRSGKVLRILLERPRWELYKGSNGLEAISSQLIIDPTVSGKWESKSPRNARPKGKFFVRDVYLAESFWDATNRAKVVLSGFGRKRMQLGKWSKTPLRSAYETSQERSELAVWGALVLIRICPVSAFTGT